MSERGPDASTPDAPDPPDTSEAPVRETTRSTPVPETTRSTPVRRRPWWRGRVAVATGAVVLVALAGLGVLLSPLFAAHEVTVRGMHRLTEARVLRIAGIAEGQNTVTFDVDAARRRLEADPWVASAEVTKRLPDTISVRITERVPVGAVETHLGWEVVAADGVVVSTPSRQPNLPTITATVPGDDVTTLGAGLLGAMDDGLRSKVGSLTIGVDGLIRLVLHDGVTVAYGGADEAVAKAQSLSAVLAWADEERAHVQVIDVSVPGAPTARLAGGDIESP